MNETDCVRPPWPARLLRRVVLIETREVPIILSAFLLYFCVMAGYFAVRPVRETASTVLGNARVSELFLMTWVASIAIVPIYGWVVARLRRAVFLPLIYGAVALALAAMGYLLQRDANDARVLQTFFVMISVLNLFIMSVFWGFLLEIFAREQTKRLFGLIAAAGTAGALAGPALTVLLVQHIGNTGVLYMGAGFFVVAILCQRVLMRMWHQAGVTHAVAAVEDRPVGGNPFIDGFRLLLTTPYLLGIGSFIVLLASVTTFLYFEQLRVVAQTFHDTATRTRVFGTLDFIVQSLTLVLQLFVTGRIATRIGVIALLTIVPVAMIAGFVALAAIGGFGLLAFVMIVRRVGEYAFVRPGREMVFSGIDTQNRYRVKHVIDVPLYRGGDWLASKLQIGLNSSGWAVGAVAMVGAALAGLWALNGWWLGRQRETVDVGGYAPATGVAVREGGAA